MRRLILVPVLIVVALLAVAGGIGYFIYDNYYYYTTDDAQVTGQIVNLSSPSEGQLKAFSVKQGDKVTTGETIATITSTNTAGQTVTTNISSPINGTIVQTSAVQGQQVTPGLAVAEVTNLDSLYVTAYVDENTLNNIKNSQDVDIHVDAYGSSTYTGHVQQIVDAAASQFSLLPTTDYASGNFTKVSQRIPVIVSLDGKSGDLLVPGMSAEVTIHLH
jgi:multidrug resistance efflux pump